MQAQAIFEAACDLRKEEKNPYPEVMIPLVGMLQELTLQRDLVERVAQETMKRYGVGDAMHLSRSPQGIWP